MGELNLSTYIFRGSRAAADFLVVLLALVFFSTGSEADVVVASSSAWALVFLGARVRFGFTSACSSASLASYSSILSLSALDGLPLFLLTGAASVSALASGSGSFFLAKPLAPCSPIRVALGTTHCWSRFKLA